jgi:HEAT repeat protein
MNVVRLAGPAERRIASQGQAALPTVLKLSWDKRPHVRFRAAWMLGLIGGERAIRRLVQMTIDRNERVWYDAQMALSKLVHPLAARAIFRLLLRLGDDNTLTLRDQESAGAGFIRQLLSHPDWSIQRHAIYMAAQNRVTRPIARSLTESPDLEVRDVAIDSLLFYTAPHASHLILPHARKLK